MTTALVLTGGGARGAYQTGVLCGVAERLDCDTCFDVITGVSAGGINAAGLAGHRGSLVEATGSLKEAWLGLSVERVFRSEFRALTLSMLRWMLKIGTAGKAPLELRGLLDTDPLREYLLGAIDFDGISANVESGRRAALALSATEYSTGSTVTFVQGGGDIPDWERARRASVHGEIGVEHVMASAALPLVFPAISVGERWYGDGAIRQSAPLAPAVHLGANKILGVSVRYPMSNAERREQQIEGYPPPSQILSMLMHGIFIDALDNDVERARRINRTLSALPEDRGTPDDLRPIDILLVRPSRDLGKIGGEMVEALPRSLRILARGLGASDDEAPDFLSYLLFEKPYIELLMEIGYDDVGDQWDRIEPFLTQDR